MDLRKIVEAMTQARGLPGYEGDVANVFLNEMKKMGLETDIDGMGNATAYMGEKEKPRIMVTAHMDEVGLMVNRISDDGAVRFTRMGGLDPRILPGSKVKVYTEQGALTGVIGAKPPHILTPGEKKKSPMFDDMYIDMGMKAEDVKKTVRVGDLATIYGPVTELSHDRLAAKTMDDRACLAALCLCAEQLKCVKLPGRVCFTGACQEENGSKGATAAAYRLKPDLAIVIDVTHGTTADCRPQDTFPLDKVVMSVGPNIHVKMHERIMKTAEQNGIAVMECACSGATGTDAEVTQVTGLGIPTVLVELPLKYMHTSVEVCEMKTLRECARLMSLFVRDILNDWGSIQWQ